jgi:hypothetical protein
MRTGGHVHMLATRGGVEKSAQTIAARIVESPPEPIRQLSQELRLLSWVDNRAIIAYFGQYIVRVQ